MPWKTIKRDCKQSSGKKGSHVVVKKKKSGGTEQESCHTSEEKAKSAIRARYANEGRTLKITRKQLRRIIKESIDLINNETGEVLIFADDDEYGTPDAPEAAAGDIMRRLGITQAPSSVGYQADRDQQSIDLSAEDWEDVHDEVLGKRDRRARKRKSDQRAADEKRLNIDNLLQRLSDWAADAARDYMGDNPGTDLQDIAYDLADAWEFEFAKDEQEELLWHFDGDLNDLKIYTAESMG